MPKHYISEYYIKNFFLSFLGLVVVGFIVSSIFEKSSSLYFSYGSSILIAMIGITIIGYNNAATSTKEKEGKPLFLHLFLVIVLFITNNIWGDSSFLTNFFRELSYLIFLQIGVYLYNKRQNPIIT